MITARYCAVQLLKIFALSILYSLDILFSLVEFTYSILIYAPYICLSSKYNTQRTKSQKSIVIIGYSFAGFDLHKNLQSDPTLKHYKFTIIEPKTYFEFTPSVLVNITKPSHYHSTSIPLTKCFDTTRSTLIHGKGISIDKNSNSVTVKLINKNTQKINFDYCFICTGSKYASPIKVNAYPTVSDNIYLKNRVAMFEEIYSKLNNYNNTHRKYIAVIGGGPVGVELTAEIADRFPRTDITVIDANSHLCRLFPNSTQRYLEQWIENRDNITLRLNTRIKQIITPSVGCNSCDEFADDETSELLPNETVKQERQSNKFQLIISQFMDIEQYKSDDITMSHYQLKLENKLHKYEKLEFDMVFRCAGFQPNSEILRNNIQFENCLTDKYQFIKVDEWMRVVNNKNIFALGDVIHQPRVNEIKLAHTAEIHAQYFRDLMVYLEKHNGEDISLFTPYHEWLLGHKITNNKDTQKKWNMPLVFTISLGMVDGSMGFGEILLNGVISVLMKWFIETSLCKLYQRKGIYDITMFSADQKQVIFRFYPIGTRIFTLFWKFNHLFTIWYIRHFNK
eukprot:334384_1